MPLIVLTDNIQCEFIPHDIRDSGRLGIHPDRGLQGRRGWGRQPGAFDLPSSPETPPLLNVLAPRRGVQLVQMLGLHERGGGDRVPQHVKRVPGGESAMVRK